MMTKEGCIKITNFRNPGAGRLMLECGHVSYTLNALSSTLSIYSILIVFVLRNYNTAFRYIFFLWYGCWYADMSPPDNKSVYTCKIAKCEFHAKRVSRVFHVKFSRKICFMWISRENFMWISRETHFTWISCEIFHVNWRWNEFHMKFAWNMHIYFTWIFWIEIYSRVSISGKLIKMKKKNCSQEQHLINCKICSAIISLKK